MKFDKKKILIIAIIVIAVLIVFIFLTIGNCSVACIVRGYAAGTCKTAPVIPGAKTCSDDENGIGVTLDCNPGGLVGASYNCCCK